MNNIEMLRNIIQHTEEYDVTKVYYEILKNKMSEYMRIPVTDDIYISLINVDSIIVYYKELRLVYEKYSELVLNCYHFDFIRNDDPMKLLNRFIEYMIEVEEAMSYNSDIDTEGECML